jgi:hypothetical protein
MGFWDRCGKSWGNECRLPSGMCRGCAQDVVGNASPTLDSLCHSAVRVDQLFDHVYGNLNCHGVSRVDQDDHVYGNLSTTPPGLHLPATTTGTTGDNHDYDHEAPNYYYYSNYYHITPRPLYCCAQGDLMPRASRERSPFFGGHSAGRGGALDFGLRGSTLGGGSRDEWLADKNFSLCCSLASPIAHIPTPYHHSVGAGDVAELLNAPTATCTESECCHARDTIVAMNLTSTVDAHAPVNGDQERLRVLDLCDFFKWPRMLLKRLNLGHRSWTSSTAFSGIGCPEIAAAAIHSAVGREVFAFQHGIERDHVARAVLASHHPSSVVQRDILAWLPPTSRARIATVPVSDLRGAIFDRRVRLDLKGPGDAPFRFGDCHVAGPPCGFFPHGGGPQRGRAKHDVSLHLVACLEGVGADACGHRERAPVSCRSFAFSFWRHVSHRLGIR